MAVSSVRMALGGSRSADSLSLPPSSATEVPTTSTSSSGGETDTSQLSYTTKATDLISRFVEGEGEYEDLPTESHSVHIAAGCAAGVAEHCLMYPVDLVKTRRMALRAPAYSASLSSIAANEGIRSLWRGMPVVMLCAGPAHAAYFTAYEVAKGQTGAFLGPTNPVGHLAAGAVASLVHDVFMTPVDAVKQRMQKFQSQYRSGRKCAAAMFREEGVRAFYRSYGTQICMNLPQQMIHFSVYEWMKRRLNPDNSYRPSIHIVSGATAGGAAAFITTPFDVCKTLLNTQPTLAEGGNRQAVRGLLNSGRIVYATAGFRGFFKGCVPRMLTIMPSTAICWWVYEMFKYSLRESS